MLIERHALEHLASTDRGVVMLRRIVREGIRAVARGEDPFGARWPEGEVVRTFTQDLVRRIPVAATPEDDRRLLRARRARAAAIGPVTFLLDRVADDIAERLSAVLRPFDIAVDLGTGSGAIALSLATEVPHARVHAAENSVDAFVWAEENFREVGAENARLAFIDLEHAFPELDGTVSVVASNPPYVPDAAIPRDPEVRLFDPPAALYGGEDGLDVVRILSGVGLRLAHPGGTIVIEHGEWQGEAIRDLLAADGWRAASTHPDLTMRDRATTAIRP